MPNSRRKTPTPPAPPASPNRRKPVLTAKSADRHDLYERSVQTPDVEIAFIDRVYTRLRKKKPLRLREDFCGTAWMACEWVKHRPANTALGLDLDEAVMTWGTARHAESLTPEQCSRLDIRNCNVLTPPSAKVDVIAALNFSYFIFRERATLCRYFQQCRRTLAPGGLLFLDFMGGSDCQTKVTERTRQRGFTYVWEHAAFDPISSHTTCKIHFEFPRGPAIKNAFVYHWRLWSITDIRELLAQAGFKTSRVFLEGDGANGKGDGTFRETRTGDPDRSFVGYVVAG